jgi:tRNA threonylcarbamoyladenosine biosynthesis protein TsaB
VGYCSLITLAIDTSEARGSVALVHDRGVALRLHNDCSEYSAWLLPAVNQVLAEAGGGREQLQLLAVSTGPGSFTGLRVGLTTAKAWAEVYGTPMVGVSRLAAMAQSQRSEPPFVAACYDAQRAQLFAALYRRTPLGLERVGEEMVISPHDFVSLVNGEAGREPVSWISADPELIRNSSTMATRIAAGDQILSAPAELTTTIARLAQQSAANGQFTDPLALDANYVRRSDAEIFWKGTSSGVR